MRRIRKRRDSPSSLTRRIRHLETYSARANQSCRLLINPPNGRDSPHLAPHNGEDRVRFDDKWHLDEVFIEIMVGTIICGVRSTSTATYSTCWSSAAETRKQPWSSSARLLKRMEYASRVIITSKLVSYGVTRREMLALVEHR